MLNRAFPYLLSLLVSLIGQSAVANEMSPNQKALQIAREQTRIRSLVQKLEKEAKSISDRTFRKDALSILQQTTFKVINDRQREEAEIIQKLQKESLLNDRSNETPSLFPKENPMPFIAASGSPWLGHHSYPGGLVYHTYTNLMVGLRYAETYKEIYGVKLRGDYIRLAAIWHDSAKTMTLPWASDGSCAKQEIQIAGTAAHHIFAVAEAIYRRYPFDFIVTLASAHNPPLAGQSLTDLIRYLKAGAIIAGLPYSAAGLTENGTALSSLPPIEAFINHLDDHDYVLTQSSINAVDEAFARTHSEHDYWKRDEIFSKNGDLTLYQSLLKKRSNQ